MYEKNIFFYLTGSNNNGLLTSGILSLGVLLDDLLINVSINKHERQKALQK